MIEGNKTGAGGITTTCILLGLGETGETLVWYMFVTIAAARVFCRAVRRLDRRGLKCDTRYHIYHIIERKKERKKVPSLPDKEFLLLLVAVAVAVVVLGELGFFLSFHVNVPRFYHKLSGFS